MAMKTLDQFAADFCKERHNTSEYRLESLRGGRNNAVFKLSLLGHDYVLKQYFRHPGDSRDRGATEYDFVSYAWQNNIRRVPCPLLFDNAVGIAAYEFIDGKKLQPTDVSGLSLNQANDFLAELNAAHLERRNFTRVASEACFSLLEHLGCIESRVLRLVRHQFEGELAEQVADFVHRFVAPEWERIRANVEEQCRSNKFSLSETLSEAERLISPSDFGFHNAIQLSNGEIRFLDFEYAGWDDPAKTICDFFLQPAVPVPLSMFDDFLLGALGCTAVDIKTHRLKTQILFEPYKIKWCCIMLNEFMPVSKVRRDFSSSEHLNFERLQSQLDKAKACLSKSLQ